MKASLAKTEVLKVLCPEGAAAGGVLWQPTCCLAISSGSGDGGDQGGWLLKRRDALLLCISWATSCGRWVARGSCGGSTALSRGRPSSG